MCVIIENDDFVWMNRFQTSKYRFTALVFSKTHPIADVMKRWLTLQIYLSGFNFTYRHVRSLNVWKCVKRCRNFDKNWIDGFVNAINDNTVIIFSRHWVFKQNFKAKSIQLKFKKVKIRQNDLQELFGFDFRQFCVGSITSFSTWFLWNGSWSNLRVEHIQLSSIL